MKDKNDLGAQGATAGEAAGSIDRDAASHVATELGCAGHLAVSNQCAWRRHTQIGSRFRVSTVGNYFPGRERKRDTVGSEPDSFFETMVFETIASPEPDSEGCGCLQVLNYDGLECKRYATAGEAQSGHERMVREYVAKTGGR